MKKTQSSLIAMASLAPMIIIVLTSSAVSVDAFSALPTSSPSSTIPLSNRGQPLYPLHSMPNGSINDDISPSAVLKTDTDRPGAPWPTSMSMLSLQQQHKALQALSSTLRLSLLLLFSVPFVAEPAVAATSAANDGQGVSAITQSSLGTSVRSGVVQSAKLVDAVDLKWERFSDSLRDNKKCDPLTNRRLFDNGIRSDGTPRGNPVLGALCDPVALKTVNEGLLDRVLGGALDDAASETLGLEKESLQQLVDKTRVRVGPAFQRAFDAKTKSPEALDEARKQQKYNLEVYTRIRAYGEAVSTSAATATTTASTTSDASASSAPAKPPSKASVARKTGKKLDRLWGRNLLDQLAGPSTAKCDFRSPFPKPSPDIAFPYDANQLTNALGAIEVALEKLQDGGLIGHWEISIPEDDYGEVVTIAIDDDVCIGAQILAQEENSVLRGSPVVAMVRSALEDRAKIPYISLDVFFIDPTTTKNELYNPTQLLVSIRNLGEEP